MPLSYLRLAKKRGHSLLPVTNGREAVEVTGRENFDLIFIDVQTPEMAFGATRAQADARLLERLGETGEFADAGPIFADLERETTRISTALEELSGVST